MGPDTFKLLSNETRDSHKTVFLHNPGHSTTEQIFQPCPLRPQLTPLSPPAQAGAL